MDEDKVIRGAVEIIAPNDEGIQLRLETIAVVARACERLAMALETPAFQVTINGNITANAPAGVVMGLKKRKR